ncbi:hypothetical protein BSLG_009672 [Batrachochytrium salamandrivorans]|nr:hypothetical protein BSLG_009672 [Batrachochytrium salamandrivorans]
MIDSKLHSGSPTAGEQHPKVLVFLDFDGTIATKDTGTVIIDSCMGATFRDAVEKMWGAVVLTWEEGMSLVSNIPLDPKFAEFFELCSANAIPITVVSSGIQALVDTFLTTTLSLPLAIGHAHCSQ